MCVRRKLLEAVVTVFDVYAYASKCKYKIDVDCRNCVCFAVSQHSSGWNKLTVARSGRKFILDMVFPPFLTYLQRQKYD